MDATIKEFRDGIFALHTRRFGTVAELMIEKLFGLDRPQNQFHDRYDSQKKERIEIKFSTAIKKNATVINDKNIITQCIEANLENRLLYSTQIQQYPFDCNIQQVKCDEFDILYYGIFFADKIAIFTMTSTQVLSCPGYSDFQHKGNTGEGQFHLNQRSIDYHLANHLVLWLTYDELYRLFQSA